MAAGVLGVTNVGVTNVGVTNVGVTNVGVTDLDVMDVDSDRIAGTIGDDELTALALAFPTDHPADPDATADRLLLRQGPLPLCYMPPTASGRHGRWLAVVALVLIAAFLTITALGFCITYGALTFA